MWLTHNHLILGLLKSRAIFSDSDAVRRLTTPVDEMATTSVRFLSGDCAHAAQVPLRFAAA